MSYSKRLILVLGIVVGLVLLDQLSKWIAIRVLMDKGEIDYLGGLFRWRFATNKGAFLSLGSTLNESQRFWLLTAFNGVILVVVALFLLLKDRMQSFVAVALALILAGGIGNLIDRLFRDGHVIDFMNIGIKNLRTGIFNVADLAIVGGLALLVVMEFRNGKRQESVQAHE
ncbi:MAG: signal peptidase II [Candidatus Hydrogenedentes bacterium]|nr:signal peptidase II [Candidatus Hydrogenedentota bacterium]MBI3117332.1 signal peptidase II [Candidatus Hydrogenedentota bacterium]